MEQRPFNKKILDWRKRHRYLLQVIALAVAVLASFAIHFALVGGIYWLAGVFFALLALSMLVTVWAG